MKKSALILLLLAIATAAFSQDHLKIMSYNVRSAKGMDGIRDYQRVANIIRNAAPDVVAVQELDSMTRRNGGVDALGEIALRAQMHPTYCPAIEFDGGKYGIGILSREVPLKVERIPLPGREEERALVVAEFGKFLFACTHLSLTEEVGKAKYHPNYPLK